MDRLKTAAPYMACVLIAFYLLPHAVGSTGGFMLLLLIVNPLICLGASWAYARRVRRVLEVGLFTGCAFAPTVLAWFNETAWIYVWIYVALSLLGACAGRRSTLNSPRAPS